LVGVALVETGFMGNSETLLVETAELVHRLNRRRYLAIQVGLMVNRLQTLVKAF
jgi:hypothetical protein